ncbi:MAG: acetylglutamate kinase [Balneolales bacterium]|nr:acetylglutamate kinase [Balneolales bacterium]
MGIEKKGRLVVIKYGGNAMTDTEQQLKLLEEIVSLHKKGDQIVLIHGGGPEINKLLTLAQVQSEFISGHRKTTEEVMYYVELALRGSVNGRLVRMLNSLGVKAVGLSGKDGGSVIAKRRYHLEKNGELTDEIDIGFVGDVQSVDTTLYEILLKSAYMPVLAPVALGTDGKDYNINADIFAGAIAGALGADCYVSITNVNGLYANFPDEESRIEQISVNELANFINEKATGGMLPKLESVLVALQNGVQEAHIINGTESGALAARLSGSGIHGTLIK